MKADIYHTAIWLWLAVFKNTYNACNISHSHLVSVDPWGCSSLPVGKPSVHHLQIFLCFYVIITR